MRASEAHPFDAGSAEEFMIPVHLSMDTWIVCGWIRIAWSEYPGNLQNVSSHLYRVLVLRGVLRSLLHFYALACAVGTVW